MMAELEVSAGIQKMAPVLSVPVNVTFESRADSDGTERRQNTTRSDVITTNEETASDPSGEKDPEVEYDANAASLFMDIEACRWEAALRKVEEEISESKNEQSRTWVCHGMDSSSSSQLWSVWRRLPLHEACRRQPPVELVVALIASYPESVRSVTHFGELPLHLACGCGASDDIVTLLLSAYPRGAVFKDHAGRKPLDVANETNRSNRGVIPKSLQQCEEFVVEEEQAHEKELQNMKKAHAIEVRKLEQRALKDREEMKAYLKDIKVRVNEKVAPQKELEKRVKDYQLELNAKASLEECFDTAIQNMEQKVKDTEDENEALKKKILVFSEENNSKNTSRDEEVKRLTDKIVVLASKMKSMEHGQNQILEFETKKEKFLNAASAQQKRIAMAMKEQDETIKSIYDELA